MLVSVINSNLPGIDVVAYILVVFSYFIDFFDLNI